jgi:hypothetical protein
VLSSPLLLERARERRFKNQILIINTIKAKGESGGFLKLVP